MSKTTNLKSYLVGLDKRFEPYVNELADLIVDLATNPKELDELKEELGESASGDYCFDYFAQELCAFNWPKLHPNVVSFETWEEDDDLIDTDYALADLCVFLSNGHRFYERIRDQYMPILEEMDNK